MHTRESGASYCDPGHIWKDTPRDPNAIDSALGFLTRLGNSDIVEALMVEMYSFPNRMSEQTGIVYFLQTGLKSLAFSRSALA